MPNAISFVDFKKLKVTLACYRLGESLHVFLFVLLVYSLSRNRFSL